eukprot:TRINITY_DN12867_c0_g1_i2.p1 TRINITY_DN12867_c0_g1~~TRINITY_DN12867_c0_g1_i2.p1  ORF type:complete len:203 (-),score=32.33 TRINITY_DN12867_c0_g1_i2:65-673(-)
MAKRLFLAMMVALATAATDDWLVSYQASQPTLVEGTLEGVSTLTLSNGLISRVFGLPGTGFATIGLTRHSAGSGRATSDMHALRSSSPECAFTLDGVAYTAGGLSGQSDMAFLNTTLLKTMTATPGSFEYKGYRTRAPTARYTWTPGARHSDDVAWPPLGLTVELLFTASSEAPAAHKDVNVTVVYEFYLSLIHISEPTRPY